MTQPATTAAARNRPRPTCTHLQMERIYVKDDTHCPHCGRVPLVGFLYECRQDAMPIPIPSLGDISIAPTAPHVKTPMSFPKTKKRTLQGLPAHQKPDQSAIEAFNLSTWITKAIKDGHYMPEQIERIKAQRVNVLTTIVTSTMNRCDSAPSTTPPTKITPNDPGSSAFTSSSNSRSKIQAINAPQPPGGCDFRCCPTCRPLSRDRTYASFEEAFAQKRDKLLTESDRDPRSMRVDDVNIVRTLGTMIPPPPLHKLDSIDTFKSSSMNSNKTNLSSSRSRSDVNMDIDTAMEREDDDLDIDDGVDFPDEDEDDGPYIDASSSRDLSRQASRLSLPLVPERASLSMPSIHSAIRSSTSGVAFAESLKAALKETIHRYLARKSYSDIGTLFDEEIEQMSQNCDTGDNFDIGRWREMSERLLVRVAYSKTPSQDGHNRSEESEFTDAKMTEDVEEDENAGVELTEEAVDTHSPDIITQV